MKILLAEDEPATLDQYNALFKNAGYEVVATTDGEQCLAEFKTALQMRNPPFDLVILDHRMPKKFGLEIANELARISPSQKILIATAYDIEVEHKAKPNVKIITKPFDLDYLLSIVNQIIHHR